MSTITLLEAKQEGEVSQHISTAPEKAEVIHDPHARDGRISETLEEFHERLASIPTSELHDLSPELKALTGILRVAPNAKSDYAAYYEYMELKHR